MSTIAPVNGVSVVHWNPRHRPGRRGRQFSWARVGRRKNNFGDLLGPMIVAELSRGLAPAAGRRRLLSVGSILHFARAGDVVWGSGINGKITETDPATHLDVRAVRGPRTRQVLLDRGIAVPEVFGDPALLLPGLRPDLVELAEGPRRTGTLLVPNLNDHGKVELAGLGQVLDPTSPLEHCLRSIVGSERVVSSSLHGLVVAEAFGIPVVPVCSPHENTFKYEDYVRGTGRQDLPAAPDFRAGLATEPASPLTGWDPDPLVAAFPRDLWSGSQPTPASPERLVPKGRIG